MQIRPILDSLGQFGTACRSSELSLELYLLTFFKIIDYFQSLSPGVLSTAPCPEDDTVRPTNFLFGIFNMKRTLIAALLSLFATLVIAGCAHSGLYYRVSGKSVSIFNTPAGTITKELDLPSGASGAHASLWQNGLGDNMIEIDYDRNGITSVTMNGEPIPNK